ncbi:MAG: NAD(P)/FAD-dependent oxidoreductase [Chthonomonadales bacterium]
MLEHTKYLIIGGGPAAAWAARSIRRGDQSGRLMLVTREPHPPYDRPPLSKQFLLDKDFAPEDLYSWPDDFVATAGIELVTGTAARTLRRTDHSVVLADGRTVQYEKLLLATGATPRKLNAPGFDRRNIFTLRTLDDAQALRSALHNARHVVLVGSGTIGIEVAAVCLQMDREVTLIDIADRPWASLAGPDTGRALQRYLEQRGARFILRTSVRAFEGEEAVSAVHTEQGERIPADVVVVGIGVSLNTELARNAGLPLSENGAVHVNSLLQTLDPRIWAAGDIAFFEDLALNRRWNAEHHLNAKWQGTAAGATMAGTDTVYDRVPYFFSDFLDLHMILRGDPEGGKSALVIGDRDAMEFVELYADNCGLIRMGLAISRHEDRLDALSDRLEALFRASPDVSKVTAETLGF